MLTRRPFDSKPIFQIRNLSRRSSNESEDMTKSSAYNSSQGQPVRNSHERASSTTMKRKGLRTEPWWTSTCTVKLSLRQLLTHTLLDALEYIACTILTYHSGRPRHRIDHQRISRGTRSKAFSRSTKAKNKFFSLAKCFFWS